MVLSPTTTTTKTKGNPMKKEEVEITIAKSLVKGFDYRKNKVINIKGNITYVVEHGEKGRTGYFFDYSGPNPIYLGDLGEESLANVTKCIAKEVIARLRLPKKVVVMPETKTHTATSNWWSLSTYTSIPRVVILTPHKKFFEMNKKLVKLGLPQVNIMDWYYGKVFGKRDSWGITGKLYYAEKEEKLDKVLAYLKGKKKLSYELVREERLGNMEYGIEYETEWDGAIVYRLKFTDAKGKVTEI